MRGDQILIGSIIAISCAAGFGYQTWLLTESRHGRRFVRWFGPERARWVLRAVLAAGILFGDRKSVV